MAKRPNIWLKFSHLLPPESIWQRIGNPARVKGGYAFIVSTRLPNSPLRAGGTVYMLMRYDEKAGTILQAGAESRKYVFSRNKSARDALIHYAAQESEK